MSERKELSNGTISHRKGNISIIGSKEDFVSLWNLSGGKIATKDIDRLIKLLKTPHMCVRSHGFDAEAHVQNQPTMGD